MIDLLTSSLTLLRENRFATRLSQLGKNIVVTFEDDSLLGFVFIFEAPDDLIEGWRLAETTFLRAEATRFRAAGEKAWNVYCVVLCGNAGDAQQVRQIGWIEEDLERTRKIAACNITSRAELAQALLPLLTLQQRPLLQSETFEARLHRRVSKIAPRAADAVMNVAVNATEVARQLREQV